MGEPEDVIMTDAPEDLRIQVFGIGDTGKLLDISPKDLVWPDDEDEPQELMVFDITRFVKRDHSYCDVIRAGDTHAMDANDIMTWGASYQIVDRSCSRCTLCRACCTRQANAHMLCAHGILQCNRNLHLWHDRRKSRRIRGVVADRGGIQVSIQGYENGIGLDSEFTEPGSQQLIVQEIRNILSDEVQSAQSDKKMLITFAVRTLILAFKVVLALRPVVIHAMHNALRELVGHLQSSSCNAEITKMINEEVQSISATRQEWSTAIHALESLQNIGPPLMREAVAAMRQAARVKLEQFEASHQSAPSGFSLIPCID